MFQQLLESNVTRTPRVGSSALSTVAHAALVAAASTSPTSSASTDLPALQLDPQITVGIPPVDFTRAASSAMDFGVRSTDRDPSHGIERGVDDALVLGAEQVDRAVLLCREPRCPLFPRRPAPPG